MKNRIKTAPDPPPLGRDTATDRDFVALLQTLQSRRDRHQSFDIN
ncbi:hypothetical protein OAL43_00715 [bacterium]|nr:hypothetical protein [bacterium]